MGDGILVEMPRVQKLRRPPELLRHRALVPRAGLEPACPEGHRSSTCRVCLIPPPGHCAKIILTIPSLVNFRKVAYNMIVLRIACCVTEYAIRNTLGGGRHYGRSEHIANRGGCRHFALSRSGRASVVLRSLRRHLRRGLRRPDEHVNGHQRVVGTVGFFDPAPCSPLQALYLSSRTSAEGPRVQDMCVEYSSHCSSHPYSSS